MKPIGDIQGKRDNVKFALLDATGSGSTQFVAGVAGYKIRVLGLVVVALTANTVKLETETGPTAITSANAAGATGGGTMPYSSAGWCETLSGDDLDVDQSAAVATGYTLIYEFVQD